jgi:DNA helicase TIP49 (TBP-interacting protein)
MEKDIGKIPKNDTADIVIRIDDFGGRTGLTIREFVRSEKYTGFTKSGVRIPAEEFLKFREMINSIALSDLQGSPESPKEESENPEETMDY